MYNITVKNLSKRFGYRKVLSDISFSLSTGESLAIVGNNGSGKTTLAMLILGQYYPNRGEIRFFKDNQPMSKAEIRRGLSLVAPYLNLYDNLTAEENILFFATVAGVNITGKEIEALLERVGLEGRGHDMAGEYSSGMKQRLKYAVALIDDPVFLILDEPTANLDESGKKIVAEIIEERRERSIIILATNEAQEEKFATQLCRVD